MKRTPTVTAPGQDTSPPLVDEASRVVARPDGYYWVADNGRQEFGPFATAIDALALCEKGSRPGWNPAGPIAEAEAEFGIAEWVDPETGIPAEEATTRLEDH